MSHFLTWKLIHFAIPERACPNYESPQTPLGLLVRRGHESELSSDVSQTLREMEIRCNPPGQSKCSSKSNLCATSDSESAQACDRRFFHQTVDHRQPGQGAVRRYALIAGQDLRDAPGQLLGHDGQEDGELDDKNVKSLAYHGFSFLLLLVPGQPAVVVQSGAVGNGTSSSGGVTEMPETTTTEKYRISRKELGRILNRNFRGLKRLAEIERRDAANVSPRIALFQGFKLQVDTEPAPFLPGHKVQHPGV